MIFTVISAEEPYKTLFYRKFQGAGGSADPGSGEGADGAHSDHADAEDGRV